MADLQYQTWQLDTDNDVCISTTPTVSRQHTSPIGGLHRLFAAHAVGKLSETAVDTLLARFHERQATPEYTDHCLSQLV